MSQNNMEMFIEYEFSNTLDEKNIQDIWSFYLRD